MAGFKTDDSKVRNVDLIHTYYSGKKLPSKKEVVIYKKKNRLSLGLKIALALLSLAVIITVLFFAANRIYLNIANPAGVALFPARHIGEVPYYNYERIRMGPAAIVLKPQSRFSVISFKRPKDLSQATIIFNAKGERGTEKIAIILRDVNMMSNANSDDIILTSPLPIAGWQTFNIRLKELNLPLDKGRITQIRFDAREVLTNVENGGNIYIKDIQID